MSHQEAAAEMAAIKNAIATSDEAALVTEPITPMTPVSPLLPTRSNIRRTPTVPLNVTWGA